MISRAKTLLRFLGLSPTPRLETVKMSASAHSPSSSTQECFFLDKLPAELRNVIYELVFVPITITQKKEKSSLKNPDDLEVEEEIKHVIDLRHRVNLCTTRPPPRDLVLTCREIYSEANKMHKAAYRNFWESNYFAIDDNDQLSKSALLALREIDLQHMGGLDIYHWHFQKMGDLGIWVYCTPSRLLDNKRGWDVGDYVFNEETGEEKWENDGGYCRAKYAINMYSRVGARYVDWERIYGEEELEEALEQHTGPEYDVPLKAQIIPFAMQRFEDMRPLWLAKDDDEWFEEYSADYVGMK